MVWKKVMKVSKNMLFMGRDVAINQALYRADMNWGVTIYNVITTNPIEITLNLLAVKLGFTNKLIISLIIAFIL